MSTPSGGRLVARYRRLLLAYPRWHRDLHAADMLTTLMDEAADGRGGPRAGLTLIADGIRCRFRVGGWAALVFAMLCAVAGAGLAAGLAGRAAWEVTSKPWPTQAQAQAMAAPVLPAGAPVSVTRFDDALGGSTDGVDRLLIPLLGDPEWHPGGVTLHYVTSSAAARGVAAAPSLLHVAGWHTHSARGGLVAERDDVRLTLLAAGRDFGTSDVVVQVYPAPPTAAYTAATVGIVVGAVGAWLVAAAAVARQRRQSFARRVRARLLATGGILAVLPATTINVIATVQADTDASAAPPWLGFGVIFARPGAAVGAVLLMAALVTSRNRHGAAVAPAPSPRTT
ncbi:hypothetical protein AB0J80_11630 [Actinoplanes sp. NPDC049548]|uniref:hypothetical protein n=1 Tax=Actinoplanes sp. NPDC049548 TaxID=3155152 RepID=UPI00343C2A7A